MGGRPFDVGGGQATTLAWYCRESRWRGGSNRSSGELPTTRAEVRSAADSGARVGGSACACSGAVQSLVGGADSFHERVDVVCCSLDRLSIVCADGDLRAHPWSLGRRLGV